MVNKEVVNKVLKKAKNKKIKLTPSEILSNIIDEDALLARKARDVSKDVPKDIPKSVQKEEEKEVIFKWWEHPMDKKLFKKKKINNEYYGHYEHWDECVWIGGYSNSKELDDVIKSYIEETKKPITERNIPNIHSVIIK